MSRFLAVLAILAMMGGPVLAYSPLSDPLDDTSIKLFVGYRNNGVIVGQQTNLRLNNVFSVQVGVETGLQEQVGLSLQPNNVDFGFGFKVGNFGYYHDCAHSLDTKPPAGDGYRRDRFYVDL